MCAAAAARRIHAACTHAHLEAVHALAVLAAIPEATCAPGRRRRAAVDAKTMTSSSDAWQAAAAAAARACVGVAVGIVVRALAIHLVVRPGACGGQRQQQLLAAAAPLAQRPAALLSAAAPAAAAAVTHARPLACVHQARPRLRAGAATCLHSVSRLGSELRRCRAARLRRTRL